MVPVAVIAASARTSLGALVPAAAAARARMLNATAFDLAEIPGAGAARTAGHAIEGLDPALVGLDRLSAVAAPAAADLATALRECGAGLGRTGLYLGAPRPRPGDSEPPAQLAEPIAAGLQVVPSETHVFAEGRAGTVRAIEAALAALSAGRVDHAVVGGCESKLDRGRLADAFAAGRLKTDDYPVGFIPGEAAAFAVLAPKLAAASRARAPHALLCAAALAFEDDHQAAGRPPVGKGLSAVIVAALTAADALADAGTVWLDLNGESYRASDWGMALVRARRKTGVDRMRVELPVLTFGDVGASFPVLAIALASRSFTRGYASGTVALVCVSSDGGQRAAFAIRAAPPPAG